jgi:hypothetical protein
MKKFIVYANCQSYALAQTLLENIEFSSTYEWVPIPPVQNLKEINIPEVTSKVKSTDLFIYQPIAKSHNRPKELSSKFLIRFVKPKANIISFPSIYFDGYFPHLSTFKGYVSTLNLVHDYFIAYACSIGISEEETFELVQDQKLYPEKLSIKLAEKSLKRLKDRESYFNIDITISEFIRENYQRIKLFNQFNHPKRAVFKYIAESIMQKLGIASHFIDEEGPSHLDKIMTPIYRSTHKNLKLEFEEDFECYNGLNAKGESQKVVISEFFKFYKLKNLDEIMHHVSKIKPFIPKIIKNITKRSTRRRGRSIFSGSWWRRW